MCERCDAQKTIIRELAAERLTAQRDRLAALVLSSLPAKHVALYRDEIVGRSHRTFVVLVSKILDDIYVTYQVINRAGGESITLDKIADTLVGVIENALLYTDAIVKITAASMN